MNTRKICFFTILYAALSTLFLTYTFSDDTVTLLSLKTGAMGNTLFFLAFLLLFYKTTPLILKKASPLCHFLALFIAAIFSLFSVMGKFITKTDNMASYVQNSFLRLAILLLLILSGTFLFYAMIRLVSELRSWKPVLPREFSFRKFPALLQKHPLMFIGVIWLPQILLRYPGTLTGDIINSLKQYWGKAEATTQHPILYTVLTGKLIDFGISIGHPGIGLYLLVLLQSVLMFLVLAYTLRLLKELSVPSWLYLLTILFFALAPIFVSYAATIVVDTLYNIFFLLMMDELVWYLFFHDRFQKSWTHYLLTAIAMFGLHFRHNGIYVGLFVFAAGILIEIFFLRKGRQKAMKSLIFLAVLLLPILGGKFLSNRLYEQYDATYTSTRALLALPIQQISRCMYLYGDEIDDDIIEDIQRVLTWDVKDYQDVYRTYTFDRVKAAFRTDCTSEDMKAFLSAWMKLFAKYPADCIDATVGVTYLLFSPQSVNQSYYVVPTRKIKLEDVDLSEINKKNAVLKAACSILDWIYDIFGYLPGIGLLVNQGFTDLILLAVALYALLEKKGRLLYLCLPLLLTLGITFVGPMVKNHARYTYPIMYTLPLLLGIFITYSRHCSPKAALVQK